jgi:hypothetical protein
MPDFGVLKRVELRGVWPREDNEFTPWLAEHLEDLGESLKMDLELVQREAPVGDFALDLLCRDGRGRVVVVENQLAATDHTHLGQLITYASGYKASVVVWIAHELREAHRQALDWLNQHTDPDLEFYGVVVEVLQIDDSKPAFHFRPVSVPNEWGKRTKAATEEPSELREAYRAFFQPLLDELRERHHFTGARVAQPQNWYSFASGTTGISYGFSFAQRRQVRSEVWFPNKVLFDALQTDKASVESEFREALLWERLDNRTGSRIAAYRPGSIDDDPTTLQEIRAWAVEHLLKFKEVFGPRIASLARR